MDLTNLLNKAKMAKPAAMPAFQGPAPAAKPAMPKSAAPVDGLSKFQSELKTGQVKPNLNQPAAAGQLKKRLDLMA